MNKPELKAKLKDKTIEEILKLQFSDEDDEKFRINNEAVKLMVWLLETFVLEGAERARQQASIEGFSEIDIEHFEKILPQLLLDFS